MEKLHVSGQNEVIAANNTLRHNVYEFHICARQSARHTINSEFWIKERKKKERKKSIFRRFKQKMHEKHEHSMTLQKPYISSSFCLSHCLSRVDKYVIVYSFSVGSTADVWHIHYNHCCTKTLTTHSTRWKASPPPTQKLVYDAD